MHTLLHQKALPQRNLIKRFFSKLKHFRRVATRYDKLADNFLAGPARINPPLASPL